MAGLQLTTNEKSTLPAPNKQRGDYKKKTIDSEQIKNAQAQHTESRLAGYIRKVWERNRRAKLSVYDRLLYCLRARRGQYSSSELNSIVANGGADPVYLRLTATKCRAASSWIRDIILPPGERPWSLVPTSEPEIPQELYQVVKDEVGQEVEALSQLGVIQNNKDVYDFSRRVKEKVLKHVNEEADKAADRMQTKIADMMDEGDWDRAIEEFIEDFVTYPTAFLKGPYLKKVPKLKWGPNFKAEVSVETIPCWKRVSPFDMYPSPHSRNLGEGELIERLRMTRQFLFDLIGMPGYNEEQIREVLRQFERGNLKDWIWEDFEKERLESDTTYFTSEPDTIDAVHYWGAVKGELLKEWGVTDELDSEKPYEVEAILIGHNVIRAEINTDPLKQRPYHFGSWDPIPSSIWGLALPEQMEEHQKIVNACARSLLMNLAVSAGPQITIMVDQLAPGEDVTSIYPFQIRQMKSLVNGSPGAAKPVDFYQPDMNAGPLLTVLNTFEQKADDVTNVPRYSYGNEKIGGAGSTASGLSMLLNSAAKGIRRAISHIDANVIRPTVYQAFIHVMLTSDDMTLKGDCEVVPRGATAILIKDQSQIRVQTFLTQTANPIDMQIIGVHGRAELLRQNAKLLDLPVDSIIPSDDDIAEAQAKQQQQQKEMMQQQMIAEAQGQGGQAPGAGMGTQMDPTAPSMQATLMGNESQIQQNKLM